MRIGALVVTASALMAMVARGQAVPSGRLAQGTLAFDANATLGAFTGITSTVTGALTGADGLAGVRGWIEAPSRSLTTSNGHRDRDMASSLEIDKFATLRFDLDSVTPGAASGDSTAVTLHGRLTIHGRTRAVDVPGYVSFSAHGARFRGSVPVSCKDYGVGGLKKMLGVLKMDDAIKVRIDVSFTSTA